MNKYQKLAVKCAKDDLKKCYNNEFTFKFLKNFYLNLFKKNSYCIKKAIGFKNWNKTIK